MTDPLPRQPTEAMLIAARDWSIARFHRGIGNEAAIGCWQAMFDAAPQVHSQPESEDASFDDIYSEIGQGDFGSHERYLIERVIEEIQKKFNVRRRT